MALLYFCGDTFCRTRSAGKPLDEMRPVLGEGPVFLNLETSLASRKPCAGKFVTLQVAERDLDLLPESVRFVNIVNNHAADSGDAQSLADALGKRGKTVLGPENPSLVETELKGRRLSFVGAYFPLPRLRLSYRGRLARRVESLLGGAQGDYKIVTLHWGYEHTEVPAPFQRRLAHRLIDAGADIIVGHHPHFAQGCEWYKNSPIFYSLGNFNFWQFGMRTTRRHRLGYMVAYDLRSREYEIVPYLINDNYQPVPLRGADMNGAVEHLETLCGGLDIGTRDWFRRYYASWHNHERRVYFNRCREEKKPLLVLKFAAWLLLPMQLQYYACMLVQGASSGRGSGL